MPEHLSPAQTRRFVVGFLVALFGLAILATVLILRGQSDPALQEQVETIEARRNSELPRLGETGPSRRAPSPVVDSTAR